MADSMTEVTEEHIKAALDGTFTVMTFTDYGPKVITQKLESWHVLAHELPDDDDFDDERFEREARQRPLSSEDEDRMFAMRDQYIPWKAIGKLLKRKEHTLIYIYKRLCRERGIEPKLRRPSRVSDEFKARVANLKDKGLSQPQIAERMKAPLGEVRYAWDMIREARNREGFI